MAEPMAGTASTPEPEAASVRPESMLQTLMSVWRELPGLVSDRVELFSLEMRRASIVLAHIVAMVVAIAILSVTAWLVLWGGIVTALVAFGLPVALALLVALVFNLLAAWLAFMRLKSLLPKLSLPATRRHLTMKSNPEPEPDAAASSQS